MDMYLVPEDNLNRADTTDGNTSPDGCCVIILCMCFRCRRWAVPSEALSGPSASWIVCCSLILCGCSCHSTKTQPSTSCSESLLGYGQVDYFNHMALSVKRIQEYTDELRIHRGTIMHFCCFNLLNISFPH